MKVKDLFNKTFEEVLTDYCMIYSPECDMYYGIAKTEDAIKMFNKLKKKHEDAQVFFSLESLVPSDVYGIEENTEIIDAKKLDEIIDYFGYLD